MNNRTHIDLFSGIGGFALAAKANGIETVQFVECDKRCRDFLSKAWQGVAIHDDIRTFHWGVADAAERKRQGLQHTPKRERRCQNIGSPQANEHPHPHPVYLLTAGVPCQPASRAGKQRGAEDDRWLWPEAIRVLREVAPAWCLFENPPGIGDLALDGILSDVEAQGYEVEVLSIPACAVNAPQRRERYWIVGRRAANTEGNRPGGTGKHEMSKFYRRDQIRISTTRTSQGDMADAGRLESGQDEPQWEQEGRTADRRACEERMDNSPEARCDGAQRYTESDSRNEAWLRMSCAGCQTHWDNFVWLPCADGKVRRSPDDTFGLVDGLHRSILGALGNSIVPQVAERVIAAMVRADKAESYD